MLQHIRTVLIHNTHPGNIGAAARALKNMGLNQLYLVAPKIFPSEEATHRAASAKDILDEAVVVSTLDEALKGCSLVYGTSGRLRSLQWPTLTARDAAVKMSKELPRVKGDIALLFGCEQHGLSNEEIQQCHAQIVIPANGHYASLNLAQAVQIISYELRLAFENVDPSIFQGNASQVCVEDNEATPLATFDEMQGFYQHLEQALIDIQFLDPNQAGQLMARLRRLFARARPDRIEMNLLRGILTALQKRV